MTIVDILPPEAGNKACENMCKGMNVTVFYFECDVRDGTNMRRCMRAGRDAMKGLDCVINNAGIVDEDNLARVVGINLGGVVNGTESALEIFREEDENSKHAPAKRGLVRTILNVGSAAGAFPLPDGPYYAASKHGVVGYTKSIGIRAKEKDMNVDICCVCPAFARTGVGILAGWKDIEGVGLLEVDRVVKVIVEVLKRRVKDGLVLGLSERGGVRWIETHLRKDVAWAKL